MLVFKLFIFADIISDVTTDATEDSSPIEQRESDLIPDLYNFEEEEERQFVGVSVGL